MKMLQPLMLLGAALLSLSAWAQAPAASGEVTKIDRAGGRVTLKHGEIKHLDMPPMTMAFHVKDARMLDGLAVGDKLRFQAERIDGKYTLTSVSKTP